jgi:hypothetical protein
MTMEGRIEQYNDILLWGRFYCDCCTGSFTHMKVFITANNHCVGVDACVANLIFRIRT